MRSLWGAVKGFHAHRGLFMAAGLSFYLLMCVIPLLLLVVSAAGFVLTSQAAAAAVLNQLSQMVPVYRTELNAVLSEIIAARKTSGILGLTVLILFSTQLFAALRLVLNEVFLVRRGRGLVRGLLHDVLMIVVCGVLFLASIAVGDLFLWLKIFVLGPIRMPPQWIEVLFVALGLGFSTTLFFITYRYFPNRRVPVGPAVAGALVASVLWEVAKRLFRWYIGSVGVYDVVYGPFGVLIALAMFAYYSALVLLLGAELAAALEARRGRVQCGS